MTREIRKDELEQLLELYLDLHETGVPEMNDTLRGAWDAIMNDANHHIIVCEENGELVSSCVCVIIPNLTRGVRPYALIENVVTRADRRRMGYGTACLEYAKQLAGSAGCYKIMLLTGSKKESTHRFYEKAGFSSGEKTAFTIRLG